MPGRKPDWEKPQDRAWTRLVSRDLYRAAALRWMILRLALLSMMDTAVARAACAEGASSACRTALTAERMRESALRFLMRIWLSCRSRFLADLNLGKSELPLRVARLRAPLSSDIDCSTGRLRSLPSGADVRDQVPVHARHHRELSAERRASVEQTLVPRVRFSSADSPHETPRAADKPLSGNALRLGGCNRVQCVARGLLR